MTHVTKTRIVITHTNNSKTKYLNVKLNGIKTKGILFRRPVDYSVSWEDVAVDAHMFPTLEEVIRFFDLEPTGTDTLTQIHHILQSDNAIVRALELSAGADRGKLSISSTIQTL